MYASSVKSEPSEHRKIDGFESITPANIGAVCFNLLCGAYLPVAAEFQNILPLGTPARERFEEHKLYWFKHPPETIGTALVREPPAHHLGLPTLILREPLDGNEPT
jgi:hypothetical protein